MKKILLLLGLLLVAMSLNAHGECLLKNLKLEKSCTGGASGIDNQINSEEQNQEIDKKKLEKEYQIPTMSVPQNSKFGFPMLNQNCINGVCFAK